MKCFEYYIQYLVGDPNKSITFADYIESLFEIFCYILFLYLEMHRFFFQTTERETEQKS